MYSVDILCKKFGVNKEFIKEKLKHSIFKENIDYNITKKDILLSHICFTQLNLDMLITNNADIKYIKRYIPEENSTLKFLYETFKNLHNIQKNYKIDDYIVDLYLIDYNLVIQCDEINNKYYNDENEDKKEEYIKDKLKCKYIRFNESDKYFKLTKLMNNILDIMININDFKNKELELKIQKEKNREYELTNENLRLQIQLIEIKK